MRIRLGLIGASNQGREHLAAASISDAVDIVAVCDTSSTVLASAKTDFGPFAEHLNVESMLRTERLDGLIVALPHHVYSRIWHDVTSAGLPILKEKPLARTMSEAIGFLQVAKENGCPVMTAIQRRYHGSYQFLKSWLTGKVARSVSAIHHLGFEAAAKNPTWREQPALSGGGALLDCGYHMIDLIQSMLGPISLVSCNLWLDGQPTSRNAIESDVSLIGKSNATWVRIEISRGGDRDASGNLLKQEKVILEAEDQVCVADRSGVTVDGQQIYDCGRTWQSAMVAQLETFAKRISSKDFDAPSVWEQLPAMQLIEQAYAMAELTGASWFKEEFTPATSGQL